MTARDGGVEMGSGYGSDTGLVSKEKKINDPYQCQIHPG